MINALFATGLAGLVSTAALLAVVNAKNVEEGGLRARIDGFEACATEVSEGRQPGVQSRCPEPIRLADEARRRGQACDAALLKVELFAVAAHCSTEAKTVVAQRDAAARERDNLSGLMADLKADQAAAIARAEARGRSTAQRTASAKARLDAAPRSAAGLGQCDADCLRGLGAG